MGSPRRWELEMRHPYYVPNNYFKVGVGNRHRHFIPFDDTSPRNTAEALEIAKVMADDPFPGLCLPICVWRTLRPMPSGVECIFHEDVVEMQEGGYFCKICRKRM